MTIDDCVPFEFPKISDPRGNLTFIEGNRHIPFDIKRIYYIYDVPTAESRGAHAHRTLQEVIVCLSGSFEVSLDDGERTKTITMNRPWSGFYIPPLIWTRVINFAPSSVCFLLASACYDPADYYYDYKEFLAAKAKILKTV